MKPFSLGAFKVVFWKFDYNVSWFEFLWVDLTWRSLSFLHVYVFHQIWEVFNHFSFKCCLLFLVLVSIWDFHNVDNVLLDGSQEGPVHFAVFFLSLLIVFIVLSSILLIISAACPNLSLPLSQVNFKFQLLYFAAAEFLLAF